MPLTTTEIQADKDRLRAEFAVTARRLEMEAKALKDKSNVQFIEINRVRDELKQLAGEGARKDQDRLNQEGLSVGFGGEAARAEHCHVLIFEIQCFGGLSGCSPHNPPNHHNFAAQNGFQVGCWVSFR